VFLRHSGPIRGIAAPVGIGKSTTQCRLARGGSPSVQSRTDSHDRLGPSRPADHDLVLTRIIDTPRENLYRARTERDLLTQCFARAPWTTPKGVRTTPALPFLAKPTMLAPDPQSPERP